MNKGKENKPHIGIYGRRNTGKSSLINYLSGQEVSIVSDFKGTTTDPVKRSFEIIGFAPVIFIDTAGIDDVGEVGKLRTDKTLKTISNIDLAIILISENNFENPEIQLIEELQNFNVPYFIVHNKSDVEPLDKSLQKSLSDKYKAPVIDFSTYNNSDKELIFSNILKSIPESSWKQNSMLGGVVNRGDIVLLITPVDSEAPEGRMILPQVQVIRDILDNDCIAMVSKENEVEMLLQQTQIKPKLVITDSQIFSLADRLIPKSIPLTSFSILLARHKGNFEYYLKGTSAISELKDNDKILILESCSHHVSCEDIGKVKIPSLLSKLTGKNLDFTVVSGLDNVPGKITDYALVVQCGGCVLTRKQITGRLKPAIDAGIPVTNYGMLIAYVQGIYNRAIEIFVKDKTSC